MSDETKATGVMLAIAAVAQAMSDTGIAKNSRNSQQNYAFRGIDDVLNALASEYAKAGLIVVPEYSERQCSERKTSGGGALFSVTVRGEYRMFCVKDGSALCAGPFYGEAMDVADKATNKAMSAAYKYFAIQTFAIPTEGDNDADATTHDVAPAATQQRAPQQREQRREAPAQRPQGAVGGLTFSFGKSKDQPVSGASVADLRYYRDAAERSMNDPARERFFAANKTMFEACTAELRKHEQPRGSDRISDPSEPDGYEGPGMGDDDIPFGRVDVVFG